MPLLDDLFLLPSEFLEDVTIGGVDGSALDWQESADAFGMHGRRRRIRVSAADFPAIAAGDAVTFQSTSFTVKDTPEAMPPDGAWLLVDLELA